MDTSGADEYFAHLGIEVDEKTLAHYGRKGMKWGVRNDRPSGSSSGSRWTEDQKKKARNVAVVAGVLAVGAASVAARYYSSGAQAQLLTGVGSARASTVSAGKKLAEETLKAKGTVRIDPTVAKFIKDTPARMLSDQKVWSEALGKSLGKIQAEDASFIADYIKNYAPKALGA